MRLIVAAYRTPFNIQKINGENVVEKSPGGLVSALEPIMKEYNGIWVGSSEKLLEDFNVKLPYVVKQVKLTKNETKHFYEGFCNSQIWPLFHYFPERYKFDIKDWSYYKQANQKFANQILEIVKPQDRIWIHDYQLMLVPLMLREKGIKNKIGFFLHTPFPNFEVYRIFPKRLKIIESLLNCDLIGFHTESYKKHFMESVKYFLKDEVDIENNIIKYKDIESKVIALPISVDFNNLNELAKSQNVRNELKKIKEIFKGRIIGLGVDRLDYSKGILEKFEGLEIFWETHKECLGKMSFVQIAVPTRINVPEYAKFKKKVDETVGRINGKFSQDGWVPIHYIYSNFKFNELVAYYMLADFIIVSALRDGLNLVAKEYASSKINNDGALILSEFTGAAEELPYRLLINPYDPVSIAGAVENVLELDEQKKISEMKNLRDYVKKNDIFKWLKDFLAELD